LWPSIGGLIVVWLVYLYAINSTVVASSIVIAAAVTLASTLATFALLYWRGAVGGRTLRVGTCRPAGIRRLGCH